MAKLKFPAMRMLEFGMLDAGEEARESPDMLLGGYYDFKSAAYRVAQGEAWAVVGSKGAGKTATFAHLDLLWADQPQRFLLEWDLGSFPVADVTQLQIGGTPGPTNTRAAWEFLLLLRVFASLMSDQGVRHPGPLVGLYKSLVAGGLIDGPDLRTRFVDWSRSTLKINIMGSGVDAALNQSSVTAVQLSQLLRTALVQMRSDSQHVLAIDGLDSFFAQTETQLESLGALLDAAYDLNGFFRGSGLRVSVVLAIRHDMYVQVPSTDSAKLSDRAIELDWSRNGMGDGDELWDLLNTKARASVPSSFVGLQLGDVRKAYLATPIGIGPFSYIPSFLMSHTRYLPRDLVALMNALKDVHPGSGQVSEADARQAVRQYSEGYFVREISNGLSRVLPGASANKVSVFCDALSALQSREFTMEMLEREVDGEVSRSDLRILMKQLFLIGGVGTKSRAGRATHTNFYYRRAAGGGFSFHADYVLHNSLVSAWNVPWERGARSR